MDRLLKVSTHSIQVHLCVNCKYNHHCNLISSRMLVMQKKIIPCQLNHIKLSLNFCTQRKVFEICNYNNSRNYQQVLQHKIHWSQLILTESAVSTQANVDIIPLACFAFLVMPVRVRQVQHNAPCHNVSSMYVFFILYLIYLILCLQFNNIKVIKIS